MPSLNKVVLMGHLGKDPDTRYLPDGKAVCNASIATSETWKDKDGQKKEKTEWHNLVFFGRVAEIAAEYLHKGALIYVEGKLTTETWKDKTTGQDRYATKIVVNEMKMLGGRVGPGVKSEAAGDTKQEPKGTAFEDFADDVPF